MRKRSGSDCLVNYCGYIHLTAAAINDLRKLFTIEVLLKINKATGKWKMSKVK